METFEEGVPCHALTNRDWAHIELRALDFEAQLHVAYFVNRRHRRKRQEIERCIWVFMGTKEGSRNCLPKCPTGRGSSTASTANRI